MMLLILMMCFLVGCAPSTLEDLRWEGEAEMKKLIGELRLIESTEDVQKVSMQLKKRFNRIADLLIRTRQVSGNGLEHSGLVGDDLFAELARIYEIPGAREAIEATQSEAVRRLDRSFN